MAETPGRYCSKCGQELGDAGQFCPNCGSPIHRTAHMPTPEADVPVPPLPQAGNTDAATPGQPTQSSAARRHPILTGCLGIIVIFILIGILSSLGGGGDETAGGGGGGESAKKEERREGADQAQFPDPPEKPTLETATLYVAGSAGGPYKVSWTVWTPKGSVHREFRGTGVIKDEPTAYHIALDGFRSDRNKGFFLGHSDIDMEATKTEPWKGELVIVLKANDTLVQCHTIQTTSPSDYPSRAEIEFDADSRKDYEKQAVCGRRLDS